MTAPTRIPTIENMLHRARRDRDRFLDQLAAEPLFQGVPRHHIPLVGRSVEILSLTPGIDTPCHLTREVVFITAGHALLTDSDHQPLAVLGPGDASGHHWHDCTTESDRIVALTALQGFIIGRRELRTLIAIAPRLSEALTRPDTTVLAGSEPSSHDLQRPFAQNTARYS